MASKTAYQFYHDEQMKISKKTDGKQPKDIQKQIGAAWTAMSQKEKQPYVEKKRQYDEQLQREQQALKRFQKQGNNSNNIKTRESSNATRNADKKEEGKNLKDSNNNSKAQNQKLVKSDLKKDNVEASKKVIVQTAQKVHQINQNKGTTTTGNSNKTGLINQSALTGASQVANSKTHSQSQSTLQSSSQPPQNPSSNHNNPQDLRNANHQAYLEFFKGQFANYKQKFPKREGKELTKVISQEWKLMQLSLKIRQRENKSQLKQTQKSSKRSQQSNGKILINGKEVVVPQKPLTGYLRFYKKNYEIYKAEQPDLKSNMIAVLASQQWNSFTEEQKQEFNDPYIKELAHFQRQKEEFVKIHGFFPSQNSQKKTETKAAAKVNEKKEKAASKLSEPNNNPKPKAKSIPTKNYIVVNGNHVEYPVRLSGYYLFEKTLRAQLATKKHTMDSRELSAFIGQQWKQFPDESKEEFESQQEKEYLKKRVAFIAKYGPFPEKEKKESHQKKKVDSEKKPVEKKNLNGKRKNQEESIPENGKKKMKLSEEEMLKKIERRGRINYENPDSEVEDMLSCLEEEETDVMKTEKEEDFETFERNYNNIKKNNNIKKENKNEVVIKANNNGKASTKKDSAIKNRNPLFDMLNQPIDIPDFTFGPNFF